MYSSVCCYLQVIGVLHAYNVCKYIISVAISNISI